MIIRILTLVAVIVVAGSGSDAVWAKKKVPPGRKIESVPGEIVLKLKKNTTLESTRGLLEQALTKAFGAQAIQALAPLRSDARVQKLVLKAGTPVKNAIQILKRLPFVKFAEPNYVYRRQDAGVPNDSFFSDKKLWGIFNEGQKDDRGLDGKTGADINVLPVWQQGFTGSKNIVVAVIDTGIDWTHPDIAPNLYTNPGEAGEQANNGIDDDGNGFVDDVHGWNFNAKTRNSSDDHSHGTHCAGTIGGVGDNGQGVVGVNWNVTLMPIKFLSGSGSGSLADAVESINYATKMKVQIMSNSWGGGGYSDVMKEAIEKARDAGILFVAAAGNDSSNNDETPMYPASYDVANVISVAAMDNQDNLADFSNWGRRTVHVGAPGVKVWSSVLNGGYAAYSGTSMATPHVAGVAALLWSIHSEWTYAELKDRIIKTADPVKSVRRKVFGKGRVNVLNALNGTVPPSDDPRDDSWVDVDQSVESNHPYDNSQSYEYTVHVPGAQFVRLVFEKVDVETRYDQIHLYQGSDAELIETLSGSLENYTSEYVRGDTVKIVLKTDSSVARWGFKVGKVQAVMGGRSK